MLFAKYYKSQLFIFVLSVFLRNLQKNVLHIIKLLGGKLKETPLHIAARVKDGEKCALMLLKSGAGPNLTTEDGNSPVHIAARYGNLETLLLLLEDGGDSQLRNKVNLIVV